MVNLFEFAYDNRLFKQLKVDDLLFTEYKCLEERSVFQIWSHYNYFVYVLRGKKKWQTVSSEYMIHAGEAIFVKRGANIIHKFFEVDFCALIIFVPDHFIQDVVQNDPAKLSKAPTENTDAVIPIHLDETLSAYFQSLFAYFLKDESPSKSLLEIKFKELILNLVSSIQNQPLCQYFKSLCHTSKTSLREVMEMNFAYNLKLEEFARLSGRSLTTFKRDFAETFHASPGKWLTKRRLDYSKCLLETTDKNINQLAFESGFENTSHFIKVFKKEFGTTPLQFQKNANPT